MELNEVLKSVNYSLDYLHKRCINKNISNDTLIFSAGETVGTICKIGSNIDHESHIWISLKKIIDRITNLFYSGINDDQRESIGNEILDMMSNLFPKSKNMILNGRYAWKSEIGDDKKEFYLIYLGENNEVRAEWHIDEEVLYLYLENEYSMKLCIPFEETEGIIQGILKANKLSVDSKYLSKNY